MNNTLKASLLATALSFVMASNAHATITQVATAAALNADLSVNFDIFGSAPSAVSTVAFAPVGPLVVNINTAGGELALDNGGAVDAFVPIGGFLPTDTLLTQQDGNLSDTLHVGFSQPVQGVGTQIESLISGNFIGYMDLYDSGGNLLGEVSVNAATTSANDGSAPFIGAVSDSADISYVIFSVDNGNSQFPHAGDVAINNLDVLVPEPATLSIFGVMAAGLMRAKRRRAK